MVSPFAPDPATLARILPPGFEPRDSMGLITMLTYPWGDNVRIHPFNEAVVLVPVTCEGVEANYVPYIYVTTDEALIAGREAAGWPKKLADITWERDGDRFSGAVTRWGVTILTLEGEINGAMPEELRALQAQNAGTPTLNYKLIPGPGTEIEVEEVTLTRLEIVPQTTEIGTGRVHTASSDDDALADLVPDSEGPMIAIVSDNTIPVGEVLRRVDRRVPA